MKHFKIILEKLRKRIFVVMTAVAAALLLLGVAKLIRGEATETSPPSPTGSAPPADSQDAPSSKSLAADWIRKQVRNALARHGILNGGDWTTIRSDVTKADGKSILVERLFMIKGLDIECEQVELSPASKLNGGEWRVECIITSEAHRYGELDGSSFDKWEDGAGPLALDAFKLGEFIRESFSAIKVKEKGVLWLSPSSLFSINYRSCSDQGDFFDANFQHFYHPNTTASQRNLIRGIRHALRQDYAASYFSVKGANFDPNEDPPELEELMKRREEYLSKVERIDFSACPNDFADSFRSHISAWKSADANQLAIESSWQKVRMSARRYGASTWFGYASKDAIP